ncbi:serine/threonine-protein phosphatase [Xylella taiwanensis]|uniref:Protein phosphatase n=1 Tax=Xylella taiwanensis TaxID=1444770 RepID=Z9JI27_9GAMM|nr:PP2C family serine/threonine-protein phosphatase [Xylella taiwanensis]AXI83411.1 protein phosphatase [Xylella taiwanensis]EWS77471.1 protein phosphatase [Xylella taiwanensis]MCD8456481.1 serine/threonine-protein phosphatase [Xylella taiwanensis]MCD8458888.1 serine/threonine-protein phosphatase [Xylella taiwanensis]MCD8461025.1 serine/threonine-protein phosphatase [Xylella taiwanensis]
MLEFGHLSHPGLRRDLNEDTYYGDGKLNLWLIADGIGGYACGEIASALAREVIVREVRAGRTLTEAIYLADEEIINASKHRNDTLPMGTTVVAVQVHGTRFEVAWVGDSRAYLWHDGRLIQLSQTHSFIPKLIPPTNEQVHSHPYRNVITQALGITDPAYLNIATITGDLTPGMELLLCSDGLTEEVTERDIAATLNHNDCSAQECVDTLVAAALDNGGSDNITVVLIRCHSLMEVLG